MKLLKKNILIIGLLFCITCENTTKSKNELTSIVDVDGNEYQVVKIGEQYWMAENLKVTKYRNGQPISETWVYNDYENNIYLYGRLYSWNEVNKHVSKRSEGYNIAPKGWHVPTDKEWKELEIALGMTESQANITRWRGTNEGSKLAGNANLWKDSLLEKDLEFGTSNFAGLPSGLRATDGFYIRLWQKGYFWTASEIGISVAWHRSISSDSTKIFRDYEMKNAGLSVRCVKD